MRAEEVAVSVEPLRCSAEGCDKEWGITCVFDGCGKEVCPAHYWETIDGGVCDRHQHELAKQGEWDETVEEHLANCPPCRAGEPTLGAYGPR